MHTNEQTNLKVLDCTGAVGLNMMELKSTKLNDENYDAWEFETKAELKKKGVWAIVSGRR